MSAVLWRETRVQVPRDLSSRLIEQKVGMDHGVFSRLQDSKTAESWP